MKIIFFTLPLLALLASCNKEKSFEKPTNGSGPGGDSASQADFRAVIDGNDWVAATGSGLAVILNGEINISGSSSDGSSLAILITDTIPGTYPLSQTTFSTASYSDNSSPQPYTTNQSADTAQAGGFVSITSIDRVKHFLSGTFSFNVYNAALGQKKTIRSGVFDSLPYISSLPPANGTDTFYAKINDTSWNAQSILTGTSSGGQFYVQGSNLDGTRAVILYMPPSVAPGNYTLDVSTGTYVGVYSPTVTSFLVSQNNGTLSVLENNTVSRRLRANFNFVATDPSGGGGSAQLTGGYLSVNY
jgi:hypothetical protein